MLLCFEDVQRKAFGILHLDSQDSQMTERKVEKLHNRAIIVRKKGALQYIVIVHFATT